jgi:1-acyl-sn-glycerol-3-phosphate acyltransferase
MRPPGPERGGIDDEAADKITRFYDLVRRYSRLEVEGLERIPDGEALLVANHSGWAGFDFANLYATVREDLGRDLYTAVHPNWFLLDGLGDRARRIGLYEASVTESVRLLDDGNLVLFFPEGEEGSFKPFAKRNQLEEFKPGFARVASASMAPIVPVVVVGGEEAHPTLTRLEFTKELLGIGLPVPATLLPLPVKWRVRVLDPIDPHDYMTPEAADADPVERLRTDVAATMHEELDRVLEHRGSPIV